jgi:hypothetical protein
MRVYFGLMPSERGYVEPPVLTPQEIVARQQEAKLRSDEAMYRAMFEVQDIGMMVAHNRTSLAALKVAGEVAKLG